MLQQRDFNDLYKEIVTNLLEGVMVISMNGKITMLNPAAERILGLTQDDIGNSYINVFLVKDGADALNEAILDTIYEKEKVSNMPIDYELNGTLRNLSLTTSYIHNGEEKSVVVVMEDTTELNELRDAQTALARIKKLNEEYEKAKDEAVRANEAKSLFLSNMSHEIRTPINAVLGMNEMILRKCTDKQLLSYAANIQSSGKTLLFLINNILDMSKIESGKMEIVRVEYAPEDLLMDLWNVIFLRAQEKGLTIRFSLDETLPRVLFGDDVRIKQIVTNLLTNAVKYTPQGGIEMNVAYEKQGEEEISLIISVKDTGMGIREEDMGKLFENFQRLDEEKNRNIEGTGLGMNITMSLLKLMDGDMKVESEYGKGSAFSVTIPQKIVCSEPTGDFETIKSRRKQTAAKYLPETLVKRTPEAGQETKEERAEIDHEKYLQYGISVESGLQYAQNDIDTYLDLVRMFIKDREKQETMDRFLAEQNMENYAIFVHGLKGNARTLGADWLADMAYAHERQSKAGDVEYVTTRWEELLSVWNNTLQGFQEFVDTYGDVGSDR